MKTTLIICLCFNRLSNFAGNEVQIDQIMSETTVDKKPFWERIKPKSDAATSNELWSTLDTIKNKKKKINKTKKNKSSKLNQIFDAQPE